MDESNSGSGTLCLFWLVHRVHVLYLYGTLPLETGIQLLNKSVWHGRAIAPEAMIHALPNVCFADKSYMPRELFFHARGP
jgi:hypothetical protein